MFLEVALPLPLLQTFTYRCSPDIFHRAQPGQRVLVPFRNRKVVGFVVKKIEEPPQDLPARTTLKEILELIDPLSLISTELFHLAEWVSDYYFASKGEVLRSCIPPKSNPRSRQTVVLLQGGLDALERDDLTSELSLKERKLLRVLREHQALETKELGQRAGFEIGERDLRGLVFNQCVQIQHELAPPAVAPRVQKSVALRPAVDTQTLKLTPQQNRVVQALKARAEPVSVSGTLGRVVDFSVSIEQSAPARSGSFFK